MAILSIPSDPKVREAIGVVAVRHGQLDHALQLTVKSILGAGLELSLIVTDGMTAGRLRDMIKRLARKRLEKSPDAYENLSALLSRAKTATDRRNELMHGVWTFDLDADSEVFYYKNTPQPKLPDAAELTNLANEIAELVGELHEARLHGWLRDALQRSARAAS